MFRIRHISLYQDIVEKVFLLLWFFRTAIDFITLWLASSNLEFDDIVCGQGDAICQISGAYKDSLGLNLGLIQLNSRVILIVGLTLEISNLTNLGIRVPDDSLR